MDTRTKIVTPAEVTALELPRPLLLIAGAFDILRADLARALAEARQRTQAAALMVVILPVAGELAPPAARAEMAAALRVVDYVLLAGDEHLENLAASLQPIEIIHLEESDAQRTRQLIEHVQQRQS